MIIGDGMKKGFTLVELLGVLVVLALLALITVPSVTNVIRNSKNEINKTKKTTVEIAAKNWLASDTNSLHFTNNCSISTEQLINEGFLEKNNDQKGYVDISRDGESFSYKFNSLANTLPCNFDNDMDLFEQDVGNLFIDYTKKYLDGKNIDFSKYENESCLVSINSFGDDWQESLDSIFQDGEYYVIVKQNNGKIDYEFRTGDASDISGYCIN